MRFLLDESILIRQISKKKSDGLKFRVQYGRVTKKQMKHKANHKLVNASQLMQGKTITCSSVRRKGP